MDKGLPGIGEGALLRRLMRAGVLTGEQVRRCAAEVGGTSPGRIIAAALERGYLDRDQLELLRIQARDELTRTWALRRDVAVARFVLRRQFASREEIRQCRRE